MSKFTGKEYPPLNILSQEFDCHIPEYQRPYAWTSEESGILFDDLYAFCMEEQADNYSLGSAALIQEDNVPHADAIDGQQRLTTLTILFACLAQRLRNNSEKRTPGAETCYASREIFLRASLPGRASICANLTRRSSIDTFRKGAPAQIELHKRNSPAPYFVVLLRNQP